MGLDTTHNCFHGAYSSYSRFRQNLADKIGLGILSRFEGFGGIARFEDHPLANHNLIPIINHSDCDGELSVEESKRVLAGLERLLPTLHGEKDEELISRSEQFISGLKEAISKNEIVEYH